MTWSSPPPAPNPASWKPELETTEPKYAAPDFSAPIEAWKVLNVCYRTPNLFASFDLTLASPGPELDHRLHFLSPRGDVWPIGEPIEAKCPGGARILVNASHTLSPDETCRCGIYAVTPENRTAMYGYVGDGRSVLARLQLWGKVVPGTRGYRAQFARIAGVAPLHADRDVVEEAARLYGAELLELPDWFRHWEDAAWEHGAVVTAGMMNTWAQAAFQQLQKLLDLAYDPRPRSRLAARKRRLQAKRRRRPQLAHARRARRAAKRR